MHQACLFYHYWPQGLLVLSPSIRMPCLFYHPRTAVSCQTVGLLFCRDTRRMRRVSIRTASVTLWFRQLLDFVSLLSPMQEQFVLTFHIVIFMCALVIVVRRRIQTCFLRHETAITKLHFWYDRVLESFEMWCWRRMEKISWTDHVRNEDVLLRVKEQRNILHEIRKRKANWIGHNFLRNCLLQRVIEGKIEGG
jgi:hypothetical protein